MRKFLLYLWIAGIITGCDPGATTVYYLDSQNGNDSNPGLTPGLPWKSLSRTNEIVLKPGDQVLLKAGSRFSGSLTFKNAGGSLKAPVILGVYGKGKAYIQSFDSAAVIIENAFGFVCRNLVVTGSGRLNSNKTDGLFIKGSRNIEIDSVEASGYLYSGIHVKGGSHIKIAGVYAHDNGFSGIYAESGEPEYGTDGSKFKTMHSVEIGNCKAENNPGCPAITDNHSGSGILIAGVVNGYIHHCEAMNNGWDMPREGNGPVGIWAYMCDSVVIENCFSHDNKTSEHGKDGGGFDFDGGIRYSVMQNNISANNEGAGYGIFQYAGATEWKGNVMRNNTSYNDGVKNSRSGIFMWCDPVAQPMRDFEAYNNTVVTCFEHAVSFEPGDYEGFIFSKNVFLINGNQDGFIFGNFKGARFSQNIYSAFNMPASVEYDTAAVLIPFKNLR
ncbi:MAG TPA: right-handed parallel beta-helix repeat-containing protein [Bacteroidales bacterium]|nr:right-handed parallel beta-helix repeat-containing protein [Bacteroidales bacterium]